MRFVYAFAAEGQSLPAKFHGADEVCIVVRYAWWKLIFNYGSEPGATSPAMMDKRRIGEAFRSRRKLFRLRTMYK
jgi:hypothetical protein